MGNCIIFRYTAPIVVVVLQLIAARGCLCVVDGAIGCRIALCTHLGTMETHLILNLLTLLLGHSAEFYSCKGREESTGNQLVSKSYSPDTFVSHRVQLDVSMYLCGCLHHTITTHSQFQALLQSTVLTAIPIDPIDDALLVARTLIIHDGALRSPEESLAALTGDDAVVHA